MSSKMNLDDVIKRIQEMSKADRTGQTKEDPMVFFLKEMAGLLIVIAQAVKELPDNET